MCKTKNFWSEESEQASNESSTSVQKTKMRHVYKNSYKLSVKFIFNSTIIYTSAVPEIARNIKFNKFILY